MSRAGMTKGALLKDLAEAEYQRDVMLANFHKTLDMVAVQDQIIRELRVRLGENVTRDGYFPYIAQPRMEKK